MKSCSLSEANTCQFSFLVLLSKKVRKERENFLHHDTFSSCMLANKVKIHRVQLQNYRSYPIHRSDLLLSRVFRPEGTTKHSQCNLHLGGKKATTSMFELIKKRRRTSPIFEFDSTKNQEKHFFFLGTTATLTFRKTVLKCFFCNQRDVAVRSTVVEHGKYN